MVRLGYDHYLASNAGPSAASPAQIDFKLADFLATNYSSSCLGTHLISPPLCSPRLPEDVWEWTKWSIALFFRAGILGYEEADFSALERSEVAPRPRRKKKIITPAEFGLDEFGVCREPNTLAYALCDSPVGLLVFVLKNLRVMGPNKKFTEEDIITFTELAWLPGPEASMRLWAGVVHHGDKDIASSTTSAKATSRPTVAITVFLGENADEDSDEGAMPLDLLPTPSRNIYACPGWGNAKYDVVHAERVVGKPGLLAWERPEVIVDGVRGLARKVLERHPKLKPKKDETVPLEGVMVSSEGKKGSRTEIREVSQLAAKVDATDDVKKAQKMEGGPSTPSGEASRQLEDPEATPRAHKGNESEMAETGILGESGGEEAKNDDGAEGEADKTDKGKGKEVASPPEDDFLSGESPDTIVRLRPMTR